MRLAVPLIAAASLSLGACHFTINADDGPAQDRTFPVTSFTRLVVAGPYEVSVRSGPTASVGAKGSEDAIEAMVVEVKDGELAIHPANKGLWNWGWRKTGKVVVTVTVPALEAATIAGSGGIRIDRVTVTGFKGEVAGSGDLDLGGVDTQSIKLAIAGSGDIRAAGKARAAELQIAGSGNIDAGKLIAETAKASVVGSGDINAHATGSAELDIMGSGDIVVSGGAKCNATRTGSGSAKCS